MRVKLPFQFLNVDHHADGVIDRRGRGVVRQSRSVSNRIENSKSTRVTDAEGAKVKQWLHDFLSYPWVVARRLPMARTAVRNAENGGPAGARAVTAIENPRHGSAERNERPRGAAVFDF